jgi:hypothetical protein
LLSRLQQGVRTADFMVGRDKCNDVYQRSSGSTAHFSSTERARYRIVQPPIAGPFAVPPAFTSVTVNRTCAADGKVTDIGGGTDVRLLSS